MGISYCGNMKCIFPILAKTYKVLSGKFPPQWLCLCDFETGLETDWKVSASRPSTLHQRGRLCVPLFRV